ncbi:MAG TPA: hypothetical protein VKA10_00050 [Prolixibacteraceae bacterium]|nr:hypothetical protein [Prolixibacteraceae bacterium]
MRLSIIILAFISCAFSGLAQGHQNRENGHEDRWDKIKAEKVAFFTEELDLTPDEAQKFWPVYNEMEDKRWEAQKSRRELEKQIRDAQETMSEKEIKELTRQFAGSLQQESDLYVKYNEKFLDVLPSYKVLKLYKAENEFRMHMIKKWRGRKNNDNKD